MTKIEAGYHLPDSCCARCSNAYQSTYGDVQCTLITGVVVDLGGLCNGYKPGLSYLDLDRISDQRDHFHNRQKVTAEGSTTCADCKYVSGTICVLTGKVVTEACKKYEQRDVRYCKDCNNSYYDPSGVARCNVDDKEIDADDTCDNWTDTVSVVCDPPVNDVACESPPADHNCITCYHSFYGDDGLPYCRKGCVVIDDIETPCFDWEEDT